MKFIAHFWNGHTDITRHLNAAHIAQAQKIAEGIARSNGWKRKEVNSL